MARIVTPWNTAAELLVILAAALLAAVLGETALYHYRSAVQAHHGPQR